jgi:hypothetical protein
LAAIDITDPNTNPVQATNRPPGGADIGAPASNWWPALVSNPAAGEMLSPAATRSVSSMPDFLSGDPSVGST